MTLQEGERVELGVRTSRGPTVEWVDQTTFSITDTDGVIHIEEVKRLAELAGYDVQEVEA